MEKRKHILLCVAGGTLQVITETLWWLANKTEERVDEIRVITTKEGRKKVLENLLDEKSGRFHQFCKDFPEFAFERPLKKRIKFDEKEGLYLLTHKETGVPNPRDDDDDRLQDILTTEENQKAANQICDIVRELTQDKNVRLHATVAGGRKTMGLYLMAAMQMFGRNDDIMSHVLVNAEVENKHDFFYITPEPAVLKDRDGKALKKKDGSDLTTHDGKIYLAQIPFICLRGLGLNLLDKVGSRYNELVDEVQSRLRLMESAFKLRFDLKDNKVIFGTCEAKLNPKDFFVYLLFAYYRKYNLGDNGFLILDRVEKRHINVICRSLLEAKNKRIQPDEEDGYIRAYAMNMPRGQYVYRAYKQGMRRKLNTNNDDYATAEVKSFFQVAIGKIENKLETAKPKFPPECFLPSNDDVRGSATRAFALKIPSDRIELPIALSNT